MDSSIRALVGGERHNVCRSTAIVLNQVESSLARNSPTGTYESYFEGQKARTKKNFDGWSPKSDVDNGPSTPHTLRKDRIGLSDTAGDRYKRLRSLRPAKNQPQMHSDASQPELQRGLDSCKWLPPPEEFQTSNACRDHCRRPLQSFEDLPASTHTRSRTTSSTTHKKRDFQHCPPLLPYNAERRTVWTGSTHTG